MKRTRKQRRNSHGSARHWRQTDCWYFTLPGTKRRVSLIDEQGERIRGKQNRELAEQAFARVRLNGVTSGHGTIAEPDWIVGRVCSDYVKYCRRSVKAGSMSREHRNQSVALLNDFCGYCGALPVADLKKSHVHTWLEAHEGWKSTATHRTAIAILLAAFNWAEELHDVPNPLKGLKKPQAQPRLQSFSPEEKQLLYGATEEHFRIFYSQRLTPDCGRIANWRRSRRITSRSANAA